MLTTGVPVCQLRVRYACLRRLRISLGAGPRGSESENVASSRGSNRMEPGMQLLATSETFEISFQKR
jgi:hypothetical protein